MHNEIILPPPLKDNSKPYKKMNQNNLKLSEHVQYLR